MLDGVVERRVYAHTGWRRDEDGWFYVHAGGAIGTEGTREGVEVSLPGALHRFELPSPPTGRDAREAVKASLRLVEVAPYAITWPMLGSVYAPIVESVDFSTHLSADLA
jgi:hypothetical protein